MGMKSLVVKGMLVKVVGGGLGFAVLHAILFWVSYFQCGGAHNSLKGIWQGISNSGSVWASLVKWLGFPLASIDASGVVFVLLMIVNSLLWGTVIGIICGLVFRKKL